MECNIGTILLFAGKYAPENFALCDGRQMRISENAALYSILMDHYGGDNKTYFNLPKLEAPDANMKYIICTNGMYPVHSN